ncbi:hypothetical protein TrLO_g3643, partial [Triparma laevis f. longispina]
MSRDNPVTNIIYSSGILNLTIKILSLFSIHLSPQTVKVNIIDPDHLERLNTSATFTTPSVYVNMSLNSSYVLDFKIQCDSQQSPIISAGSSAVKFSNSSTNGMFIIGRWLFNQAKMSDTSRPVLVPELIELLVPDINILLDKKELVRYHGSLLPTATTPTSNVKSRTNSSKNTKTSSNPPTIDHSIDNAINAPLISETIRLLQWMTLKMSVKSLNVTLFDDDTTAGVNLSNLEISASDIIDHVQQSAEISLSLEEITSSFSDVNTSTSINPINIQNLNTTLTGSLTNRAVSLNFGVKASPTVQVDHPLLTKIAEIMNSPHFKNSQPPPSPPIQRSESNVSSLTGKKIKQIDLSLLLHNATVSLHNRDETSLHFKVGVMRGSSQIMRIGDRRLPPFFLECRKIGLGLENTKQEKAVQILHIHRVGADINITNQNTIKVNASVNNLYADVSPALFQFSGVFASHLITTFKLKFPPFENDIPMATKDTLNGDLHECFDSLKSNKPIPIQPDAKLNLNIEASDITVLFPHSTHPEVPHMPSVQDYLTLRQTHPHEWETCQVKDFKFSMTKGRTEEFDLQIHHIKVLEGVSPNAQTYVDCEWFGLTQRSFFKHLDIFGSTAQVNFTPSRLLKVIRVSRDITFSVWDCLTTCRWAQQQIQPSFPGTLPYDSIEAYQAAAKILPSLIAGDGNVAKRLLIKDVDVALSFNPNDNSPLNISLSTFMSNELPEQFAFKDVKISITKEDVVSVGKLELCHCIDNNPKIISGRKLLDMRVRHHLTHSKANVSEAALKLLNGSDGFVISIQNVKAAFPHSISNFGNIFRPIATSATSMASNFITQKGSWTPESRQEFRKVFWRPPPMSHDASFHLLSNCDTTVTAPVPKSSIALSNIELCIVDDPLESWLQEISPLWNEELEERVASNEWVSRVGQKVSGRETRDYFYDSKRWIDRIKTKRAHLTYLIDGSYNLNPSPPSLLRLTLKTCQIDCDVGNSTKTREIVNTFNSTPLDLISIDVLFLLQTSVSMSMAANGISVNIRGQTEPIVHISDVQMGGDFAILMPETRVGTTLPLPSVMSLPKIYVDMRCHCSGVSVNFRPVIMYGMQEAAAFANRLLPQSFLPENLTWWDVIRMTVDAKMLVTVDQTEMNLLGLGEKVSLRVGGAKISYMNSRAEVEGIEVTAQLLPSNDYVPALLELPHFNMSVDLIWACSTSSALFRPFVSASTGEIINDHVVSQEDFTSRGLSVVVEARLSGNIKRGMLEWAMGGGGLTPNSKFNPIPTFTFFFAESIKNLVKWGRVFSAIPPAPFPKKCSGINLGINALVNHVIGATVKFKVDAFEVCFFDTNPFDVEPRGLRLSIEEVVEGELVMRKWEKGGILPDPFVEGILQMPGSLWCVKQVVFKTGVINARICSKCSGSRGKFLFVLDSVSVEMGGVEELGEAEEVEVEVEVEVDEARVKGMMDFANSTLSRRMSSFSPRNDRKDSGSSFDSSTPGEGSRSMSKSVASKSKIEKEFLLRVIVTRFKLLSTQETNETLLFMGKNIMDATLDLVTSNFEPPSIIADSVRKQGGLDVVDLRGSDLNNSVMEEEEEEETMSVGSSRCTSLVGEGALDRSGSGSVRSRGESDQSAEAFMNKQFEERGARDRMLSNISTQTGLESRAETMMKLIIIEVLEPQIQLVDDKNKGCAVFGLNNVTLQARCSLEEGEKKRGKADLHKELQKLATRGCDKWTEIFMVSVCGAQFHVAPADVDVGAGLLWLPKTAFEEDKGEEGEEFKFELDQRQVALLSAAGSNFTVPNVGGGGSGGGGGGGGERGSDEGVGVEVERMYPELTVIDVWHKRRQLCWEARHLGLVEERLKEKREELEGYAEDKIMNGGFGWAGELEKLVKESREGREEKEKEGKLMLEVLHERIRGLTLRTRQLEFRPNLQLFMMIPSVVVELKVLAEDEGGVSLGGTDPFLTLKLKDMGMSVSSYEGGDFSFQLWLHGVKVDSWSRIHNMAELKGVEVFSGLTHKHATRLRAGMGSGSRAASRLPVAWEEVRVRRGCADVQDLGSNLCLMQDGVHPMIAINLKLGDAEGMKEAGIVRHFEVNLVPMVVAITKSQVTSLINFFEGSVGAKEKKTDRKEEKAKRKFLGGLGEK